ncbi:MAG: hypothetical protein MUF72_02570 [Elainella sp. Prado103]|nr:hypothetical protein [Elainella sp. Prado103]
MFSLLRLLPLVQPIVVQPASVIAACSADRLADRSYRRMVYTVRKSNAASPVE